MNRRNFEPASLVEAIEKIESAIEQASAAAELIVELQQIEVELSRLRKLAVERAVEEGINYSEVARRLGLSRGRISQLRKKGPVEERVFFGYGPVGVGIPLRKSDERDLPVLASEDVESRKQLSAFLESLSFQVLSEEIDPVEEWEPSGRDAVVICGPKSSLSIAEILASDPVISFVEQADGWVLESTVDNETFSSGMDLDRADPSDIGYLGRLPTVEGRTVLVIAGIHALGSAGVVHYLENNLAQLYAEVGVQQFSMVIRSKFDKESAITESSALCEPKLH